MSEQIVAKPQGIITEPNKVGQYQPGAFSYSENCALRSFGTLEPVLKFGLFNSSMLNGNLVGGCYAVSDGPYSVFIVETGSLGSWRVIIIKANELGGYTFHAWPIGSPWNTYITRDGRTAVMMMRNRVIVSGTYRSFAIDIIEQPGTGVPFFDNTIARNCGVYQSVLYDNDAFLGVVGDPAWLASNQHYSATVVLRQIHGDGYELVSAPAIPFDYANLSTTLPQIRSVWDTLSDGNGNYGPVGMPHEFKIDVYRTRSQSVGYDSVGNKYLPISTGSSFYLSKTHVWNTGGGVFSTFDDTTLPSTLGEALLTNVSAGGASALPLPPPPSCKSSAPFRGHAFYANRWDPATFTLLNPYYWGIIPLATASTAILTQGIGFRTATGQTATNGSPTVTGFPNTTGVVPGQTFNVYRTDTGALVTFNNEVVSKTATTVTGNTNVTYSGNVRIEIVDRIEVNGQERSATVSPQDFVTQLYSGTPRLQWTIDVAAVGLEPITTDSPAGVYPVFVPTGGMTFRNKTTDPFTIRATNGQNFSPHLPELDEPVLSIPGKQQPNAFAWSENNEPENVPPSNYAYCGQGEIYKIIPTRDCLWFFCSDGLFRLSGAGGSVGEEYDWVIDPVDPSLVITNPMSACVHQELVYAYTNRGVVSISSEGIVRQLSDGRINPSGRDEIALQNKSWRTATNTATTSGWNWLVADTANDEIWVRDRPSSGGGIFDKIWVYNIKTDSWTIRVPSILARAIPCCTTYNSKLDQILCLFGNSPNVYTSKGATGDFEGCRVDFQPIFGGGHGAPYTQKHWQDVNLSFRSPQGTANIGVTLQSQLVSAGQRTIPSTSETGNQMEMARVGFTIPRAFPAMANSLTLTLLITPSGTNQEPVKFEGMSISYIDFSPQRVRR